MALSTVEHVHLFRERLIAIAIELLRLAFNLTKGLNRRESTISHSVSLREVKPVLSAPLDRVRLGNVAYSSRPGSDEATQKLLGDLALKIRECLL